MEQETLLVDIDEDNIAVITFNRPEARNALNLATMRRFARVVDELAENPDLVAVILTGAGETAFCSGGDLMELSQYPSAEFAREFITLMGDALLRLERMPVPVFAAINGYALGGGGEIAMACDIRIVDEDARMGFVQIRLALTPGWGAGQRLMRLVGYSKAMELLLEGRPIHADELIHLDLANHITPPGKALGMAKHIARKCVEHDVQVIRGIKTVLQAGLNNPYEEALMLERDVFPPLWEAEPHLKATELLVKRLKKEDA